MRVMFTMFLSSLLATLALSNSCIQASDADLPKTFLAALSADNATLKRIPSGDWQKLINARPENTLVAMDPVHVNNFMEHVRHRESKSEDSSAWGCTNSRLHGWLWFFQGLDYNYTSLKYSAPEPSMLKWKL